MHTPEKNGKVRLLPETEIDIEKLHSLANYTAAERRIIFNSPIKIDKALGWKKSRTILEAAWPLAITSAKEEGESIPPMPESYREVTSAQATSVMYYLDRYFENNVGPHKQISTLG